MPLRRGVRRTRRFRGRPRTQKTKAVFGRERSPVELVLVEILRIDLVEGRLRRFVGSSEFASVEVTLQLPALVPSFPLAT